MRGSSTVLLPFPLLLFSSAAAAAAAELLYAMQCHKDSIITFIFISVLYCGYNNNNNNRSIKCSGMMEKGVRKMEREREKGEALPLTWFCVRVRVRGRRGTRRKKRERANSAGLCRSIFRKKHILRLRWQSLCHSTARMWGVQRV